MSQLTGIDIPDIEICGSKTNWLQQRSILATYYDLPTRRGLRLLILPRKAGHREDAEVKLGLWVC